MAAPAITYHVTCDEQHGWAAAYRAAGARLEFLGFHQVDAETLRTLRASPDARVDDDGMLRCTIPA
ncbi:hypothetical protein ACL03H_01975 [Saccharopolyspora sp. MS10]|uniref:hypothetical protein n=1 Tax=Saccharopolyspora sp. MS10 TaxID=3385973 RepID=UPI0039A203DE